MPKTAPRIQGEDVAVQSKEVTITSLAQLAMKHLLHNHHCFFAKPEVWIKSVKNTCKNWPAVDYLCSHSADRSIQIISNIT